MVPELQKLKITEIKVRMDCNGCVQKIKKALYGINGIYDLYIDFPQQKLTIIGWADLEIIMKAIKKTRKVATICSHTEQIQPDSPSQPTESPPDQGSPPETAAAAQAEAQPQPQEPTPPDEPPKDTPPPENSKPEATPSPTANEADSVQPAAQPSAQHNASNHPVPPSGSRDVGEVHVIHHHPPEYGYRYSYGGHNYGGPWNKYHNSQGIVHEPPTTAAPVYVTHSYNTYKPPPYVTEYVKTPQNPNQRLSPYATEYEYVRTPQRPVHYSTRMERYNEEYHTGSSSNNGNITSIFSDENPNACSVM